MFRKKEYLCSANRRRGVMKRRNYEYLLGLVLLLVVVACRLAPNEEQCVRGGGIESALMNAEHERDWLSERTTRTALPTEFSSRIMPPSARTSLWRGRTHTSLNTAYATGNQNATSQRVLCRTLHAASPALFATRAVDYYIYALRHIII